MPTWERALLIAIFLAVMGGIWWLLRQLAYEWLPREVAATLGFVFMAFCFGFVAGEANLRRRIKKYGRDPAASAPDGEVGTLLNGEPPVPRRDRIGH